MKNSIHRKSKERMAFLEMLLLLLENGFSLQESIQVMVRSQQFSQVILGTVQQGLEQGLGLGACFFSLGFPQQAVTQIELSEVHGNLVETLQSVFKNTKLVEHQRREIQKIMAYPCILFLFSMGMLLSMRWILLPQLLASNMVQENHWGILFLLHGPNLFLWFLLGCLIVGGISYQWMKHKSILQRAIYWSRIPFVGQLYRLYQTSYFSLEWGKLFREGLEMKQILDTLIHLPKQSIMVALAHELHQGLREGIALTDQLTHYSFLTAEFSLIVFQGELKGRLGEELLIYNQLLLKTLIQKIEQVIKWVQPIVFLLIASVIILVYVAMFLPIYGNIGGGI